MIGVINIHPKVDTNIFIENKLTYLTTNSHVSGARRFSTGKARNWKKIYLYKKIIQTKRKHNKDY